MYLIINGIVVDNTDRIHSISFSLFDVGISVPASGCNALGVVYKREGTPPIIVVTKGEIIVMRGTVRR